MKGARGITFTMTTALMNELNTYRCGVHKTTMRGRVVSPGEAGQNTLDEDDGGGGGYGY